jgi:hypothetical protein
VPGFTFTSGAVLDFSKLPTRNLNVRANVSPEVNSVRFGYDANSNYRLESGAPFAFASNEGTNYLPWTPSTART